MSKYLFGVGSGFNTDLGHDFNVKGIGIQTAKTLLFQIIRFKNPDTSQLKNLPEVTDYLSYLGTPVFDEVVISGGKYYEITDIEKANAIPYNGMKIQSCILEVSGTKNIIKTPVQGKNGTIKEYVSDGDYLINLSGAISGENDGDLENSPTLATIKDIGNNAPEADIRNLINICKIPQAIEINSLWLQFFSIKDVVIIDYYFPQKEGVRDMQFFRIDMLSDFAIELNEIL